MEELKEKIARAMYEAERNEGHCDDTDTFVSYLPASAAALRAIEEAGYVVVRKQPRTYEVATGQMQTGFRLEEPRG